MPSLHVERGNLAPPSAQRQANHHPEANYITSVAFPILAALVSFVFLPFGIGSLLAGVIGVCTLLYHFGCPEGGNLDVHHNNGSDYPPRSPNVLSQQHIPVGGPQNNRPAPPQVPPAPQQNLSESSPAHIPVGGPNVRSILSETAGRRGGPLLERKGA